VDLTYNGAFHSEFQNGIISALRNEKYVNTALQFFSVNIAVVYKSTLSVHKLYLKCLPLARKHARMSSSLLVNSLVKNRLFKTAPDIDEPPFQFIHTIDLSVVGTTLYDSPDLVIHRTEIWAVWRPQVGRKKVWRFLTQQFNCCTCAVQCAGALSCWNTKSLPDTLRIAGSSMTSL